MARRPAPPLESSSPQSLPIHSPRLSAMKTRPLTATLSAALAAALLLAALPVCDAWAQNATDAKIRLMAEALRARDAGDLAGAQRALAQLAAVAPDDKAVQRLRAEIEAQAASGKAVVAKGAQPMVDVRIPDTAPAAVSPAPAGPAPEQEAEAIARAEAARQTEVIAAAVSSWPPRASSFAAASTMTPS